MIHHKIKNVILLIMVLVCLYLSSQVWLQLPDFLMYDLEKDDTPTDEEKPNIDIWNVVKPLKNIIKYKDNYTVLYSDNEYALWIKTINIIAEGLRSFMISDNINNTTSVVFPSQYLKFDFPANIPIDIFLKQFGIENKDLKDRIKYIKNVIIDLDKKNIIYIYNGTDTFKLENDKINTDSIAKAIDNIDLSKYTKYAADEKIGDEKINIPVPLEQLALNPVFVESELDIFNTDEMNKIAKKYFKNNYEYVRKVVEVSGNRIYMYRTEKVLKIKAEGQLDFYDSSLEHKSKGDVYENLMTALVFTENFLGFPKDGYLSKVERIQFEGNYGYRFIFSYKLYDRPILFSKVRENTALQIDVVGDRVVSYKRFIRSIDENQKEKMQNIQVLPAIEVLNKSMQSGNETGGSTELKPFKKDMIKDISNIYLGYFDLSRISKEQLLRLVWVFEVGETSYIFNAISGALIEVW